MKKLISKEQFDRARAKKYDVPYDPAFAEFIKGWIKWKVENFRGRTSRK